MLGAACSGGGKKQAATTSTTQPPSTTTTPAVAANASPLTGLVRGLGAMIGGLVVGIASQFGAAYWSPAYQDVVAFSILIAMLLIRPRGLFVASGVSRRNLSAT